MADQLAGIPTTPSDAPKSIAAWMTAVRNRLLAMKQLTDAELAQVRALLKTSNTSSGQTITTTVSLKPVFLDVPYVLYSGGGEGVWKEFQVTTAGVPADASAVIIDAFGWMVGKGDFLGRWASLRIDPSKGADGLTDVFLLCFIQPGNDAGQDAVGAGQQGIYPVANGKFEYISARPGVGWSGIVIRVLGYLPG